MRPTVVKTVHLSQWLGQQTTASSILTVVNSYITNSYDTCSTQIGMAKSVYKLKIYFGLIIQIFDFV